MSLYGVNDYGVQYQERIIIKTEPVDDETFDASSLSSEMKCENGENELSYNESSKCKNDCGVQNQERILKTEPVDDDMFDDSLSVPSSEMMKCENGEIDSSCNESSKCNNLENIFSPLPIKNELEDSGEEGHQMPVPAENFELKEDVIDIEEHIPRWKLIGGATDNAGILKDELEQRDSTVIYKCSECPFESKIKCYIVQHYKDQHLHLSEAQGVYKCEEYCYETYYKTHLTLHHKGKGPVEVFQCQKCLFEATFKSDLTWHYKYKHSKDAQVYYKCPECSYEAKWKSHLTEHYKCKHSKDAELYKCHECSYQTKNRRGMIRHYKCKHSKDAEVFKCDECSFETKERGSFNKHYKHKHSKDAEVYKCQECSYQTKIRSALNRHKHKHSKDGGSVQMLGMLVSDKN